MRIWLKLDAAAFRNRKLRQRLSMEQIGWWAMLLCIAKSEAKGDEIGTLEDVAFHMRADELATAAALEALLAQGFLTRDQHGVYAVKDFEEWQTSGGEGGSSSAERMRRKRERDKLAAGASRVTDCDASVLSQVTAGDGDAIEREREKERTEQKERVTPSLSQPRVITRPAGRGDALDILAVIEQPAPVDLIGGFDEFWAAYPNRIGKDLALQLWMSLRDAGKLPAVEVVMAGLGRWKRSAAWESDGGRFVPAPANWLRDARWQDDPPAGQAAKSVEAIPEWTGPRKRGAA